MKILGLVASPRKSGNSEILVKEMLASLPAETEKEMIRLASLDIKPCKACYGCLPCDAACGQADDLGFLLDRIKNSDAVIIASACYFLGPHTSIKTIGDRLISILANAAEFEGKKCVTLAVHGIPGWEGYAREAVNNFARFLHLSVVGSMLVQAAIPGETVREEILAAVRELANQLVVSRNRKPEVPGIHTCHECGSSLLQLGLTGEVRCVMCGAAGKLRPDGGGYDIDYTSHEPARFSPEGMAQHSRLLTDIMRRFIANRSEYFRLRKPYGKYDWWVEPPAAE